MTIQILLAGRNPASTALVKAALTTRDVDLVLAPGMSLALFLVKKNLPVLIISDFKLMDGDGLAFLQEIASESELKSIPFVFLLADKPNKTLEQSLINAGPKAILLNTIKIEDFNCQLDRLIEWNQIPIDNRNKETSE